MTTPDLLARIRHRAAVADIAASDDLVTSLGAYYAELCQWNKAINLTAFRLEPDGTDESIDRLLIEPLAAVPYLPAGHVHLLDVGSGGGSPALPMTLARPELHLCMVEARQKKAVFLRRAVRLLGLDGTTVEQAWLEDLASRAELQNRFSAASIRAVRFDEPLARSLSVLLAPGASVLYFAAENTANIESVGPFHRVLDAPLIAGTGSRLVVLRVDAAR